MSGSPESAGSQRARRAAGWQWVKVLVPPELHRYLRSIASTYGMSPSQAVLDGLWFAVYQASREWWRGRVKAHKVRFMRRDAGLCPECRARKRAERQAPRGDGSGPKMPEA